MIEVVEPGADSLCDSFKISFEWARHALGLAKPLIGDPADVPELQTAADHRLSSSARRLYRFGLTEDRVDKILVGAKTWLQGV